MILSQKTWQSVIFFPSTCLFNVFATVTTQVSPAFTHFFRKHFLNIQSDKKYKEIILAM